MFCEALNSSGELGLCEEWFNYEYFAAYLAVTGKELFHLTEYTEWVAERSSHNGTFCLKWHIGQIQDMQRDFAFELKNMNFDLIVWIYRRNPLAQAVSLARALKSNKFRSYEEGAERDVDCVDITEALAILTTRHRYLEQNLLSSINYSFAYEDVCDLTHPAYERVHNAFGKHITSPLATRVQIQRDEKSEEALRRYKTYLQTLLEHA
jgi:LPS sulfotransferase NodH